MAYDNQRAQTHKHLLCTTMKAMNIDNHWSDYTHIRKNLMSTPISDGLVCVPMAYIYIRLHTIPYRLFSLGLTTRRDTDYPLRGRQPLRQDPWHCSEGLHPIDCPGPRPTDTTYDRDACVPRFVVDVWTSHTTRYARERAGGQRERERGSRRTGERAARSRQSSVVGRCVDRPTYFVRSGRWDMSRDGAPVGVSGGTGKT